MCITAETKYLDSPLNCGYTDTFMPTASLAIASRHCYQYLLREVLLRLLYDLNGYGSSRTHSVLPRTIIGTHYRVRSNRDLRETC